MWAGAGAPAPRAVGGGGAAAAAAGGRRSASADPHHHHQQHYGGSGDDPGGGGGGNVTPRKQRSAAAAALLATASAAAAAVPSSSTSSPLPLIGRLDLAILFNTLACAAASVADPLMSLVDSVYAGRLGTAALAALGSCAALYSALYFLFFTAAAVQCTSSMATAAARGDAAAVGRAFLQASAATAVLGALLGAALFAAPGAALRPFQTADAAALALAQTYCSIRALSLPAAMGINLCAAAMRALLDLRTPFVAVAAVNVVNWALDWLLMERLGLGVAGCGWASVCSQYCGLAIFVAAIARRRHDFGIPEALWAAAAHGKQQQHHHSHHHSHHDHHGRDEVERMALGLGGGGGGGGDGGGGVVGIGGDHLHHRQHEQQLVARQQPRLRTQQVATAAAAGAMGEMDDGGGAAAPSPSKAPRHHHPNHNNHGDSRSSPPPTGAGGGGHARPRTSGSYGRGPSSPSAARESSGALRIDLTAFMRRRSGGLFGSWSREHPHHVPAPAAAAAVAAMEPPPAEAPLQAEPHRGLLGSQPLVGAPQWGSSGAAAGAGVAAAAAGPPLQSGGGAGAAVAAGAPSSAAYPPPPPPPPQPVAAPAALPQPLSAGGARLPLPGPPTPLLQPLQRFDSAGSDSKLHHSAMMAAAPPWGHHHRTARRLAALLRHQLDWAVFARRFAALMARGAVILAVYSSAAAVAATGGNAALAAHHVLQQQQQLQMSFAWGFLHIGVAMVGSVYSAPGGGARAARALSRRIITLSAASCALLGLLTYALAARGFLPHIFSSDDAVVGLAKRGALPAAVMLALATNSALEGCLLGAGDSSFVVCVYPPAAAAALGVLWLARGWGLPGVWTSLAAYYAALLLGFAGRYWLWRGPL